MADLEIPLNRTSTLILSENSRHLLQLSHRHQAQLSTGIGAVQQRPPQQQAHHQYLIRTPTPTTPALVSPTCYDADALQGLLPLSRVQSSPPSPSLHPVFQVLDHQCRVAPLIASALFRISSLAAPSASMLLPVILRRATHLSGLAVSQTAQGWGCQR